MTYDTYVVAEYAIFRPGFSLALGFPPVIRLRRQNLTWLATGDHPLMIVFIFLACSGPFMTYLEIISTIT